MKAVVQGKESEWSEEVVFTTPKFSGCCAWRECPDHVYKKRKYSVDKKNPRTATKINSSNGYYCTIIGNTTLPHNKVTSWNIKILKSKRNNGCSIYIGVAPSNINQNDDNCEKCGWYFDCYCSTLCSGPPHIHKNKKYGPRKGEGQYVYEGDSVGIVMDTTNGELSFVVNGVNLGVAYDGIPLDKPLVPCVVLFNKDDSVELDTSEVKETKVNNSIPSNITTKSITWDSITLSWDVVERASFYQIEVDGSKFWDVSTANTFTKRELQPDTEHSFRVRTVCGNEASEWSDVVKGKTKNILYFLDCGWKECPDYVDVNSKYSVDEMNPRIATKINSGYYCCDGYYCIIIGNTPLPQNKVTSWNIKILKSMYSGGGVCIGVAPSDINQNEGNIKKCGWYFHCYDSTLWSGPPHSYKGKEYGTRKEKGHMYTQETVWVL